MPAVLGSPRVIGRLRRARGVLLLVVPLSSAGCGLTMGSSCESEGDCPADSVCDGTGVCRASDGGQAVSDAGVQEDGGGDATPADDAGVFYDADMGDDASVDAGLVEGGPADAALDAPSCSAADADGDGFTGCTGDCDDGSASIYPGAPELCGDGVTNDCGASTPPDSGCMGIGTWVAAATGDDGNPGTQASPVATIRQGILNAMTIGMGVDVYVAEGTYPETLTMVEGISLWGGYEAAGWTRDRSAHVTTLQSTNHGGLFFPAGITGATVLDGFTVDGQGGPSTSTAIGIAAGASPVVSNNIVNAGDTRGASYAIQINASDASNAATPRIEGNQIRLGSSAGGWGSSNGSWGLSARGTTVTVIGNDVALADAITFQWGIAVEGPPGVASIESNRVRGTGTADRATALSFVNGGAVITRNDVDPGRCRSACSGINIGGAVSGVIVTNNVAYGGRGASTGVSRSTTAAFYVGFERAPSTPPDLTVHSNYFNGGSTSRISGGIVLGDCPSTAVRVGRFLSNVVYSGTGYDRYALIEGHRNMDPQAFIRNALYLQPGGRGGALYRDEGLSVLVSCPSFGMGAADLSTAGAVNALSVASGNIEDDCSVVDPRVDGDHHLGPGSSCIDAGESRRMPPEDFEGDARPMGAGPDIGPDEAG